MTSWPDANPQACRALWADVLRRALADAVTVGNSASGLSLSPAYKASSKNWIGGRDFRIVCALAGVEPCSVEAVYRRVMAGGEDARLEFVVALYGAVGGSRRGKAGHKFGRIAA
mgnify:CR=1 FL=1